MPAPKIAAWEDITLRCIAVYKLIKAVLAFAIGLALLRLMHHDVANFLQAYVIDPLHFNLDSDDSENTCVRWILHGVDWLQREAPLLTNHRLMDSALVSFFYGIVFATEGIGLYLKKHWAEYLVLVVTGSFLLPEIYLLQFHFAWWKITLVLGNLFILGYLTHRLRLDYRLQHQGVTGPINQE